MSRFCGLSVALHILAEPSQITVAKKFENIKPCLHFLGQTIETLKNVQKLSKSGVPYNYILDITKYFTIMHHPILLNSWPSWPHKSWWHHFWTTPGLIWPLFSIYDDDLSFWSKHTQYSLIAIQKICTSRFFLDKSLGLIWIFQHSRPNSRINQQRHPHSSDSSDSSDSLFYSWSDYEGTISTIVEFQFLPKILLSDWLARVWRQWLHGGGNYFLQN